MTKKPDGGGRHWKAALGSALSYWLWRRWRGGSRRSSSPVRQESMERGHEPEGQSESIGGILGATALLVGGVAVVIVALYGFTSLLRGRAEGPAPQESPIAWVEGIFVSEGPPEPRLQGDPAIDLQVLHQREHRRLYTYGRIDSARLHIPIGRAMQLVAERGLPADTSASADTLLVPTESGFRVTSRRFPAPPRSAPFLGSSPEPYTPAPEIRRYLTEEGYLPRPDSAR